MLVGLGSHVLWRLWYDRAHFHRHRHIQAYSHAGETTVHAVAPHAHGFRWRTLVGLMHGVAGSAALLVLAASQAPTRAAGLFMSCCSGSVR